jgi:hypothetical protein
MVRSLLSLFLVLHMSTGAVYAVADLGGPELKLWRELEAAKEHFSHLRTNFQCAGILTLKHLDGSLEKSRFTFTRKGLYACLEQHFMDSQADKDTGKAWVFCRGPKYSFFLEREDTQTPYVVRAFTKRSAPEPKGIFLHLDNFIVRLCERPYKIASIDVVELRDHGDCSIDHIRTNRPEGQAGAAAIEFTCADPNSRCHGGVIEFDPTLGGAVRGFSVRTSDSLIKDAVWLGKTEYEQYGGKLVPCSFYENKTKRDKILSGCEYKITNASFDSVADDVFSLGAYGFPEIATEPPAGVPFLSPRNGWFWGGLAIAALAFFLLRAISREKEMERTP